MNERPQLRVPAQYREASVITRSAELAANLWHRAPSVLTAARGRVLRRRAQSAFESIPRPYRLCLGSGRAPIEGWTNVDYYFPADVALDLRFGIPVPDQTVQLIYSEHLVEHLPLEMNMRLFGECRRVLAPGGRIRIATPDLAELVRDYRDGWQRHDWVKWEEYRWIDSGTRMLNVAVREWGHVYLWDFEELVQRLTDAGFVNVKRFNLGQSDTGALRNLETRADSLLVVEAEPGEGSR